MAEIAYILLCHKDVDALIEKAQTLTADGDKLAIHFDGNASKSDFQRLRAALAGNESIVFAKRQVKCGWGEWSLVEATLEAVKAAERAFPRATHFYLLSGDCMPIKSAEYAHDFLARHDADFIESFDFFTSDWIKTGFKEERLIYRHWFNERSQPKRFYTAFHLQQKFGITRKPPSDLEIMIGSQWWCLRRRTIEAIIEFCASRRDVMRFFRTTWIPDETFFQTLVRHLVPGDEIECRTLTFLLFSDYGMPVNFYNDQHDMLLSQDYLFARKISAEATDLHARLLRLYGEKDVEFKVSNEGARLFNFLTGRGRIGERFAPRFWEKDATIGRERSLMIIACKKWHVAKRLLQKTRAHKNIPTIEYLFDEEATPLPDLGGIEATLAKRTRHRRALLRLLFDYYDSEEMIVCVDPANLDFVKDFYADRCETRLLEIECQYSDDYLQGHAIRVGLAGENTTPESFSRLLPTIRNDVFRESEKMRDQSFPEYHRIRERANPEENISALTKFLRVDREAAADIANTPHLFTD